MTVSKKSKSGGSGHPINKASEFDSSEFERDEDGLESMESESMNLKIVNNTENLYQP